MHTSVKHTAIAAALGFVALTSAGAQQASAGPKWQAWFGCWTSAAPGESYGSAQFAAPVVCVTPTSNADVVEVATLADGKVIKRDSIDASGREKAILSKGCEGTQLARWSADERRVYLKSASSCDGMRSSASSILAMTPSGEWLDVRGLSAGEGENVRVARYRDVGLPSSVPAEIADALRGRSMSSQSARIAAGATIGTKAVTEATHSANASVVQAWLLERAQRFALNANDLVVLADAGIPAGVTDALVAVSNPGAFEVARVDDRSSRRANDDSDVRYGRRILVDLDPYYSPYGWGYSRYGYNGYGYNGYGYGYGNGYGGYGTYGGAPIIIVTGTQNASGSGGQMVKGQGYTQNNPSSGTSSGRNASPSSSSPSGSSWSSSGSSSSSGQSQSAPAQQPSQPAEQRTAKPKP